MRLCTNGLVLAMGVICAVALWKLLTKRCAILFLCVRKEGVGSTLDLLARRHHMNQGSTLGEGCILARVVNGTNVDDWDTRGGHQWRIGVNVSSGCFSVLQYCVSLLFTSFKQVSEYREGQHLLRPLPDHHFQTP